MDFIPVGLYFINEVGQETVEEAWRGEQRSEAALRDMGKGADEDEWKVAALLKPTRVKPSICKTFYLHQRGSVSLRVELLVKEISTCYITGPANGVLFSSSDLFLPTAPFI